MKKFGVQGVVATSVECHGLRVDVIWSREYGFTYALPDDIEPELRIELGKADWVEFDVDEADRHLHANIKTRAFRVRKPERSEYPGSPEEIEDVTKCHTLRCFRPVQDNDTIEWLDSFEVVWNHNRLKGSFVDACISPNELSKLREHGIKNVEVSCHLKHFTSQTESGWYVKQYGFDGKYYNLNGYLSKAGKQLRGRGGFPVPRDQARIPPDTLVRTEKSYEQRSSYSTSAYENHRQVSLARNQQKLHSNALAQNIIQQNVVSHVAAKIPDVRPFGVTDLYGIIVYSSEEQQWMYCSDVGFYRKFEFDESFNLHTGRWYQISVNMPSCNTDNLIKKECVLKTLDIKVPRGICTRFIPSRYRSRYSGRLYLTIAAPVTGSPNDIAVEHDTIKHIVIPGEMRPHLRYGNYYFFELTPGFNGWEIVKFHEMDTVNTLTELQNPDIPYDFQFLEDFHEYHDRLQNRNIPVQVPQQSSSLVHNNMPPPVTPVLPSNHVSTRTSWTTTTNYKDRTVSRRPSRMSPLKPNVAPIRPKSPTERERNLPKHASTQLAGPASSFVPYALRHVNQSISNMDAAEYSHDRNFPSLKPGEPKLTSLFQPIYDEPPEPVRMADPELSNDVNVSVEEEDMTLEVADGDKTYKRAGVIVKVFQSYVVVFIPVKTLNKVVIKKDLFKGSPFIRSGGQIAPGAWLAVDIQKRRKQPYDRDRPPTFTYIASGAPERSSLGAKLKQRIYKCSYELYLTFKFRLGDQLPYVDNEGCAFYVLKSHPLDIPVVVPAHRLAFFSHNPEFSQKDVEISFWATRASPVEAIALHLLDANPISFMNKDGQITNLFNEKQRQSEFNNRRRANSTSSKSDEDANDSDDQEESGSNVETANVEDTNETANREEDTDETVTHSNTEKSFTLRMKVPLAGFKDTFVNEERLKNLTEALHLLDDKEVSQAITDHGLIYLKDLLLFWRNKKKSEKM